MFRFLFRLLIPLATFAGIALHESAHAACCHLTGTRVLKVCYFRFGIPPGYVLHGPPSSPWRHALIAAGPFFLNSLGGFLGGWIAFALPLSLAAKAGLLWLAVSFAAHAFPSLEDATGLLEALWSRPAGWIARLVLTPLGALMAVGAFGAFYLLLDVAYGLALAWVLPCLAERPGLVGAIRHLMG